MTRFEKLNSSACEKLELIQSVPVIISKEGEANVEEYFNVKINETKDLDGNRDGTMANSLYGRMLVGIKLDVPKNCKGIVYEKKVFKSNVYHPSQSFEKINYWKQDEKPTSNEKFISALNLIETLEKVYG